MKYSFIFSAIVLFLSACSHEPQSNLESAATPKQTGNTPSPETRMNSNDPLPAPEISKNWLIYEGTIGLYESHVVAYLACDTSNVVSGTYYYSKHQKLLDISGTYDPTSGTYTLRESYNGKQTGIMTLRTMNDQLKGSWKKSSSATEVQTVELHFIEQMDTQQPQPHFQRYENTHQIAIFYNGNDDEVETVTDVLRVTVISPDFRSFEYNITGPNAHLGQASGLIQMENDSTGVFYGEDNCELSFRFRKKQVEVEEDHCSYYHGARAYMDNVLERVK